MSQENPQDAVSFSDVLGALRIERGNPGPEELAALTVVLTSQLSRAVPQAAATVPAPRSRWADRRHVLGLPPAPGQGSWRASALPR
ncbi:acyl-CoA carboxylase subunit epsilon [Kineococcus sp. NPDC059986]|uniref:acyl-CoA carboxylase subunit epsilon n=1 Tax=Kineococcus sp. NPDC059986 TaxID=3155538 RepID=UPI00344F7D8C